MVKQDTTFEDSAYEELKKAIVMGIYPPGSQIVEETIATQLNMSRSPVRIALKRLEMEGIVERYPNKRIYVAMANNKRTLDTLYVREALEGLAAQFAAKNRTQYDIDMLQKSIEQMNRFIEAGKAKELYFASVQFHKNIFRVAKNEQLEKLGISNMEQEAVYSYRSFFQTVERALTAHAEHLNMFKCIVKGDAEAAESAARNHVRNLINKILADEESGEKDNKFSVLQRI